MELAFVKSLSAWLMPPGINLLVLLAGLALMARRPRAGRWLCAAGVLLLYAMSTDQLATSLIAGLEVHPAVTPDEVRDSGAGAIVVLGGGRYPQGPEFGAETVAGVALERMRYGAYLHRETGLPLLVTGGSVFGEANSEASLMQAAAERDFGVSVRWVEERARNSAENALYSQTLLAAAGVRSIVLVTSASHMRRSVIMFERVGLQVLPAPTVLDTRGDGDYGPLGGLWPSAGALARTARALHEYLGMAWYRLRY